MTKLPCLAVLLLLTGLTACGKGEDTKAAKSAEGQVLPGSISDAMLPYDTVTSAPPLESPGASLGGGSGDDGDTAAAPRAKGSDAVVGEGGAPEADAT